MGFTARYLPRTVVQLDEILGEDNHSKFTEGIDIEMMMEDTDGWRNDSEIISKFGLSINNDMTFLVSKTRWNTELANATTDMMVPTRPQEGDLIWEPLSKAILEIKFVEHEQQFYPLGTNYYYKLKCEYFRYSNEDLDTGIPDIDAFEDNRSLDKLDYQLMTESSDILLQEIGDSLIMDQFNGDAYDESDSFEENKVEIGWSVNDPFSTGG